MTEYKNVMDNWIETYTGRKFHFKNPDPAEICLADIAHALSMTCRYGGHTTKFYSVAEHCVLIADLIRQNGGSRKLIRTALLHDASEAYLGDVPRPIKEALPDYQQLEAHLERHIATRFNLIYPWPDIIKSLDKRIVVDEREQAMPVSGNTWFEGELLPINATLGFLEPKDAERIFLGRCVDYDWNHLRENEEDYDG